MTVTSSLHCAQIAAVSSLNQTHRPCSLLSRDLVEVVVQELLFGCRLMVLAMLIPHHLQPLELCQLLHDQTATRLPLPCFFSPARAEAVCSYLMTVSQEVLEMSDQPDPA